MLAVFYLLVIEQLFQGLYSLWQGMMWLQMARRSAAQSSSFYMPRVALLCPLKGLETGLEQNLLALTAFDYLPYEIFFSVASSQDPVYALLERIAAKSVRTVHIIQAGPAKDCTEKVNNLRAAVELVRRALATMAGVLTMVVGKHAVSYGLPIAAGVTIYVAASDLIPEVNREPGVRMPQLA